MHKTQRVSQSAMEFWVQFFSFFHFQFCQLFNTNLSHLSLSQNYVTRLSLSRERTGITLILI